MSWKCLVGGNRRWKRGPATLILDWPGFGPLELKAERGSALGNAHTITFTWPTASGLTFGPVLEAAGQIPLPPYLGRAAEAADRERYQTVFGEQEGSVAAPTAGLHLSERLLERLKKQNFNWGEILLHVGAGTFQPVNSPALGAHEMHREYFSVSSQFLQLLAAQLQSGGPIVSVGTTTTRCLESLYYLGASALRPDGKAIDFRAVSVEQWAALEATPPMPSPLAAIQALQSALSAQHLSALSGTTKLIITPGLAPRMIDGLITNFHQPNSTLLLIVAAITGKSWRRIYQHALDQGYRFLSYGDGSLLWK
ncbi:MAG: S-adenosylmethionine:tRNA ribosyltransferase-isomerase [Lewinella sp.]|nr:S-adenosylmethionine:tRNA ribosyltransferase-isomerase [Lewinella sp.]